MPVVVSQASQVGRTSQQDKVEKNHGDALRIWISLTLQLIEGSKDLNNRDAAATR